MKQRVVRDGVWALVAVALLSLAIAIPALGGCVQDCGDLYAWGRQNGGATKCWVSDRPYCCCECTTGGGCLEAYRLERSWPNCVSDHNVPRPKIESDIPCTLTCTELPATLCQQGEPAITDFESEVTAFICKSSGGGGT
jgi:hypothetical protein